MTKRKRVGARSAKAVRSARGAARTRASTARNGAKASAQRRAAVSAAPVSAADLRKLRQDIERKAKPLRWNPEPDDVQRSVAQLVLTIVEFLRQLMERQAIRRMEEKTLTRQEVEAVGKALMQLEETIREIGARFGLAPEDLNLDLGPIGKLM